jgi:CDP-diacylglycerol--glycerol-3-phosphate 3-phosphatidyltransferase
MVLQAVKVSSLGKWKTALQMTAMSGLLILRADHVAASMPAVMAWVRWATLASWALLVVSTALALLSLWRYLAAVWHHFRYPDSS